MSVRYLLVSSPWRTLGDEGLLHSKCSLGRHPTPKTNAHPALLPPLFDAKVVRITRTQLFIAGLEIHVEGGRQQEVAQTWMA